MSMFTWEVVAECDHSDVEKSTDKSDFTKEDETIILEIFKYIKHMLKVSQLLPMN